MRKYWANTQDHRGFCWKRDKLGCWRSIFGSPSNAVQMSIQLRLCLDGIHMFWTTKQVVLLELTVSRANGIWTNMKGCMENGKQGQGRRRSLCREHKWLRPTEWKLPKKKNNKEACGSNALIPRPHKPLTHKLLSDYFWLGLVNRDVWWWKNESIQWLRLHDWWCVHLPHGFLRKKKHKKTVETLKTLKVNDRVSRGVFPLTGTKQHEF